MLRLSAILIISDDRVSRAKGSPLHHRLVERKNASLTAPVLARQQIHDALLVTQNLAHALGALHVCVEGGRAAVAHKPRVHADRRAAA